MWKRSSVFVYICCLSFAVQAALPAGEQWYLIREPELRRIEEYRKNSGAEKQNWLLQVQSLKARLGSLETESASLNSQLRTQRELNSKLTRSFNEYEAEKSAQLSLRDGEIAGLKTKLAAATGRGRVYLAVLISMAVLILGSMAIKVCRFLKIIPV